MINKIEMPQSALKQFNKWNFQKKSLNKNNKTVFFHQRDVWFLCIGENIGFEQNGKGENFIRPVIIYKKFSSNVFLGIPLTSKMKNGRFYFSFNLKKQFSTAILSQIRLFDVKRLKYLHGRISNGCFTELKEKLIELIQ